MNARASDAKRRFRGGARFERLSRSFSQRVTGSLSGKGGKVAAGSLAATIAAAVVKDLSRDNSLILRLVDLGRQKLLAYRSRSNAVDVTRDAEWEVVEDEQQGK